MPKHIDNVPKLADFRGPWVAADGTESEIDPDKVRKYIHTLLLDKAKAQDARDEAVDQVSKVEAERDEYKEQVDAKDPDSGKKIAKLEKERDEAMALAAKAESEKARLEVAMEKGLTPKQAKRLQGATKEELEADADEILELFGAPKGADGDDDEEEGDQTGRTTPQANVRLVTGGDPSSDANAEPDYEKIAAQLTGARVL